MRLPLPFIWALSLSSGSAVLLILAFPYTRLWQLTLLALVPHLLSLRAQGWWKGCALGALHGLVFQSYIMFWANFFGFPAFLFLAGYKTLLPGLFGGFWGYLSRCRPSYFPATFAVGWVAMEYLQTFGPFGVTWGMLSHALARYPILIQSCSLLGPWTVSAVLLLSNIAVYCRLRAEVRNQAQLWLGMALMGWCLNLAFGAWQLRRTWPEGPVVTVAAVQNSMGREVRWDPQYAEKAMERLNQLTCTAAEKGAHLIVWPETAIPYRDFRRLPNLTMGVGLLGLNTKAWLIVGSIEKAGDLEQHTYNSASLVSPEGSFVGRYDKQRLVPGGEYLPMEAWLRGYRVFDPVMRYQAGPDKAGIFDCPSLELKAGMLICFESMVPYLAAQRVRDEANVLVVATNDGWFGDNSAIVHHFEMAIFRAIEQGRPVIQSGNTGISGLVDGCGRVLQETSINQVSLAVGPITGSSRRTVYSLLGDLLPQGCLLLFLIFVIHAKGARGATRNG